MNLTIELREERVDKATGKICGGLATFEDIRSLKAEYSPSGPIGYKVELVLFLGDKYNKQLITLDNVEKVVACGLAGLIHNAAYNRTGTITNKETDSELLPKPTYEYEESYMEPTNIGIEIRAMKHREIKHATLYIYNNMEKVDINICYKVLDSSNGAKTDNEKEVKFIESGEFKFGKLKHKEFDNIYSENNIEIWSEDTEVDRITASSLLVYLTKPGIYGVKFSSIACTKIWRILNSKMEQLTNAVFDNETVYEYNIELTRVKDAKWEVFVFELRHFIRNMIKVDKDLEIDEVIRIETNDGVDKIIIKINKKEKL